MAGTEHLSMRVPWRDRPWDQFVCDDPLDNSSCVLLTSIGAERNDAYERGNAGIDIGRLDTRRLPCLSERATFMSPDGYTVVKQHPYRNSGPLKGTLLDTPVSLPGYAFEAVPFRWLSRESLAQEIGHERVPRFSPEAEDAADRALGRSPVWVMDGNNQRAIIDAFFEPVNPGDSLVFTYLKHSPLQDQRTDRLLVGAARVTAVKPPRMWQSAGQPPFTSTMWETIVEHSLRPEMADGILLPYQQLVALDDNGVNIESALAWAPAGRLTEFSYVTEHLSDDAAIEALSSLRAATQGMRELGIELPESGLQWLDEQIERLWQMRGPTPGLPALLSILGVQQPYAGARAVLDEAGDRVDTWQVLHEVLLDPQSTSAAVRRHIGQTQARIWQKLPRDRQDTLQLLAALDISTGQAKMLLAGDTDIELTLPELLDNPYFAAICTYSQPDHIAFTTIDRALFPPTHVTWTPALPDSVSIADHLDRRRIEALLTDVLERAGAQGDTLLPEGETLDLANAEELSQPPNLTTTILPGLDLDADGIDDHADQGIWSPLTTTELGDGTSAFKLVRFEATANLIRDRITEQQGHAALGPIADARAALDRALDRNSTVSGAIDSLEERARTEKSEGLSTLHDSPLSVLIGPAGTGKTTLLRALVEHLNPAPGSVLLLAPTGKAKVQLASKVGLTAKTLASHLLPTHRYDPDTGQYIVRGDDQPRHHHSLVVIDEASMLTEEMLAATLDSLAHVDRLILVGDPRQLPPIGAGRPFVDLVTKIRPESFASWVHVAAGYVELQVPRRQLPDGSHGDRHDLELAAWFGGNTKGAADESIWTQLSKQPDLPTVRYVQWGERTPIQALTDELERNLDLTGDPDPARAFALTYGAVLNGKYLNWEPGAGARCENWQILSPTRSRAFGSVELNRHIKRTYRAEDVAWAHRYTKRGNIPKPIGPELIVRGDKVMQTINRKLSARPKEGALNYVANGEIGVGIGRTVPASTVPKDKLPLNVEFSSQPGFHYSYWPSKSDDPMLELAWAVTVHKSQGSEFGTTFLVLPARANVSRELLYTALTRQKDRVVIIHNGTLDDLRQLTHPSRSETARRLTDLFTAPEPIQLELRGEKRRFDRKLMHISANGIPMASKNEVIIASLLDRLVPGRWVYEEPLSGSDGRVIHPDFTIALGNGQVVYWEHAGMLDMPDYARKWELKKTWYAENGILPHDQGGGPRGTLMWTDDLEGANAEAWLIFASSVLRVQPASESATTDGRRSGGRRATKKVAGKRRSRET
ncbi:AAA family ATPase [Gordonia sp. VNQ95]|uniref:AAA family ATPase n=1 Tax=Gordonia sp. VNQ95 TaxID=3156619 RepID=UPI0032B32CEF